MAKHDKPEPPLIGNFSDMILLSKMLPGTLFDNLKGQKIRMKIEHKK